MSNYKDARSVCVKILVVSIPTTSFNRWQLGSIRGMMHDANEHFKRARIKCKTL